MRWGSVRPQPEGVSVLVICTGNFCRSPIAEAFLLSRLPPSISVSSAGVAAVRSKTPHPEVLSVLADLEIDPRIVNSLRPKRLHTSQLQHASLTLVAESAHRRRLVELMPSRADRIFTFKEFARLVDGYRPAGATPEARLDDLARRAAAELQAAWRESRDVLSEDEDLQDPLGLDRAAFIRCAEELDRLLAWTSVVA